MTTKYRAKPTKVDGIRFASKREAKRYAELRLLRKASKIQELILQPIFRLHADGGKQVCTYIADFSYYEDEKLIVEDVKGYKTPMYRLKKRWMKAEHNIDILET